jgi:hypothetical protein
MYGPSLCVCVCLCELRLASCVLRPASFVLRLASCILRLVSCVLTLAACVLLLASACCVMMRPCLPACLLACVCILRRHVHRMHTHHVHSMHTFMYFRSMQRAVCACFAAVVPACASIPRGHMLLIPAPPAAPDLTHTDGRPVKSGPSVARSEGHTTAAWPC